MLVISLRYTCAWRGARAAGHSDTDAVRSDNEMIGTFVAATPSPVDIGRRGSSDVDINFVYISRGVSGPTFRVGHVCGAGHRSSTRACQGLGLSTGADSAESGSSVGYGTLCHSDGFPHVTAKLCAVVCAGNRVGNCALDTVVVGARLVDRGS